jgi:2-polyprenyl-6-methoxyphenol hydroxylase-like FAD-dependent oxidoreductase
VHRGDLQADLFESVGPDSIRLGDACVAVREDAGAVCAVLESGAEEYGDVLVGADGIHSTVRRALFGAPDLRFVGSVAWRAVIPFDHGPEESFVETWGPHGRRFGFIPIGLGRLYWFVAEPADEASYGPFAADKGALLEKVRAWHDPIPRVVDATPADDIFGTGVYDVRELSRWTRGRATLVGDAAHAMPPDAGQGAAQALEDAIVLARVLQGRRDAVDELGRFESLRRRRAGAVARRSRLAARVAGLKNPLAAPVRNALLSITGERVMIAQTARMVEYELPDAD